MVSRPRPLVVRVTTLIFGRSASMVAHAGGYRQMHVTHRWHRTVRSPGCRRVELRLRRSRPRALPPSPAAAPARRVRGGDRPRHPPPAPAARDRHPAPLLRPRRGRALGALRAHRPHDPLPVQGRRALLDAARRGPRGRERGLELPRADRGRAATSRTWSRSTGSRSTTGTRRTRRSSSTRATPSTASTCCPPRGTCGSRSTAPSWPTPRAPRSCTRPACPRAGTSRARTCTWTRSSPSSA